MTEVTLSPSEETHKIIEHYEDYYKWLTEDCKLPHHVAMQGIYDAKGVNKIYIMNSEKFVIQLAFNLNDLYKIGWNGWEEVDKRNRLWDLGMDTHNTGYYIEQRRVRIEGDMMLTTVVYGGERLDDEWLLSRNPDFTHKASLDAREYKRVRPKINSKINI